VGVNRWVGLSGLGLLAAGAAYVVAVLVAGDDLPRGTSIGGVAVGGLSRSAAEQRLDEAYADRPAVEVTLDGTEREVSPADAGLRLDAEASVDQVAGGARWSPATLWDRFTGGDDLEPVVAVDDDALDALLDELDERVAREPVDGAVRLTRKGVKVREPEPGTTLDRDAAEDALVAAYVDGGPAELQTAEEQPAIDAGDVAQAREEFAEPALSGPVTLRFDASVVTLEPRQFARALRLEPEGGELVPTLRSGALARQLSGLVAEDGQPPVDAEVRLVAGKPEVVPGKPGVSFDQDVVDEAFLDLVTAPEGERELEVPAEVVEPAFTTEDAEALQIDEQVSQFTTYFPYAEYRNTNIGRAAELVDGTVLKPGETFSLNETVGERTAENGFTHGFIISNGIFKEDLGGGVSQMATTTFNAAFFAGMTDVEHKPHSFYIDRYPVGREATVAWPTVDLRFRNDTPYGVLIHAHLSPSTPSSQGVVTVRMFSTKYWDITTRTGDRYKLTSPATRTLDTPDCYPNTGYGGFDIDVWRYWRRAGSDELERTEKMHTTYTPSDTVICKPPGSLPD
jgi:vancomycin resistance protein YoaR